MRIRSAATATLVFAVLGLLAAAQPSWAGTPPSVVQVPTLDGVGLLTLGGAVASAGAWLVSRRRNRTRD